MKIPLHIAEKIMLLANGEILPSSKLRHSVIEEMKQEGIVDISGRVKKIVRVSNVEALYDFLKNRYEVNSLEQYIRVLKAEETQRADLVEASTNSKIKNVRSFRGFLVNSFMPINTTFHGNAMVVFPPEGTFQFIFDFDKFIPDPDVSIVGIENPENFRNVIKQQYLFNDIKPLFVSRYPQSQSKDLISWLKSIPNKYYHFGDFDIAGIGIYLNEFKKGLNEKSEFFIPKRIEEYLVRFGSRSRFDHQQANFRINDYSEENVKTAYQLIQKHKKGLDQEIFLKTPEIINTK
jgi:hypothetical protein